ncbi:MAG: protein kinase [Nannocystaceae bacterium]
MVSSIEDGELTRSATRAIGESGSEDSDEDGFDAYLAAIASAPPVRPPAAVEVGATFARRYRVDRLLGRGGMGAVYLARDLELDRNIALKVALGPTHDEDVARLQREALAMARLSHPGVVTVYEAGTYEGQVYIAMEFVPGSTLRDWMDLGPHPWREVLPMFVTLARALAAAHDEGVVHRDFKPENVLLDLHGTPRVADFGIARLAKAVGADARLKGAIDGSATGTGAVVGTPAYMSPEQFRGEGEAAASDQFALCTTLFEALHGIRPHAGRAPTELLLAIEEQRRQPPRARVPSELSALIETGLAHDPERRHPSMAALADSLERVLTARRRRVLLGGGVLAAGIAGALGFASAVAVVPDPCEAAEATLSEIWDDDMREALHEGLASAGSRDAEPIAAALDEYVAGVADQRRASCEANRVEGTLSDEDFALRSACLDRVEARLSGLVSQLAEHPEPTYRVGIVARTMPALDECRDLAWLRQLSNGFATTFARDDVEQERAYADALARYSAVAARIEIGDREVADELDALAQAAQRYELPALAARVSLSRADLELDPAERESWLADAARDAGRVGMPALAGQIAVMRAQAALDGNDLPAATLHLAYADELDALALAHGRPVINPEARALVGARVDLAEGRDEPAIAALSALIDGLAADDPRRADALAILGPGLISRNRLAEARAVLHEALDASAGGSVLRRVGLLINLANAERAAGALREATEHLSRAEQTLEQIADAPPLLLAALRYHQGRVLREGGQLTQARARQEQSLALVSEVDPGHPRMALALDELAELDRLAGSLESAQSKLAQSGQIRDAVFGPNNLQVAATLMQLAHVVVDQGRPEPAIGAAAKALALLEEHDVPLDDQAEAELELGRAQAGAGQVEAARASLRSARKHCEGSQRAICTQIQAEAQRLLDGLPE